MTLSVDSVSKLGLGYGPDHVAKLGLKTLDAAMQRSGVVRLWMYDLYAESIEEDHKKRKIGAYAEKPVAEAPITPKAVKKGSQTTQGGAFYRHRAKGNAQTLPVLAPVFTFTPETSTLDLAIKAIVNSPLPTFKTPKLAKIDKIIEKIAPIDDEDEEEFLLMVA
jgi:hypothetical protein